MEPPSRLCVIIDTNQLLKDIWYSSRNNTQTALQDLLQRDEYWVFMAEPVFQEVEEKLIERRRGDVDKQIALWRTAYVPYIWTVCLKEDAYRDDPVIREMRDSDDVPTAQLYLFLLPAFLFSEDKHLSALPKSHEYSQVSAAFRDILKIQNEMRAVGALPMIGVAATSELWKAFRRLPLLIQAILGGVALGALLYYRRPLAEKISSTLNNPETQRAIEEIGNHLGSKLSQLDQASKYIQERLPAAPPPMRVLGHLVEILTVIDEPLSLDDIFHYLLARGYQPKGTTDSSKQYILSLLKEHAVFSGYSWRLIGTRSQEIPALVGSSSEQGDAM
ncbi:MAG TPA: hypothetical protein VFV38_43265 [Ktedonobacteraceae bacterium]|nr:hypothetical protein [Ktedonobacteraceae bacterium]